MGDRAGTKANFKDLKQSSDAVNVDTNRYGNTLGGNIAPNNLRQILMRKDYKIMVHIIALGFKIQ